MSATLTIRERTEVHLEASNGYIEAWRVAQLINDGWEPFAYAVSQGNEAQMYFRRLLNAPNRDPK